VKGSPVLSWRGLVGIPRVTNHANAVVLVMVLRTPRRGLRSAEHFLHSKLVLASADILEGLPSLSTYDQC
jgi:hypothetical protein